MERKLFAAAVGLFTIITLGAVATPAAAFHGAWWRGFGTATGANGVYVVDFLWGGQDSIIACGGGGCQGSGDGQIVLTDPLGKVTYPFIGVEDVRNVIFTNDAFCPPEVGWPDPLEVTPNYLLTFDGGALSGVQRNCLSSGNNRNDFQGSFLNFALVIHSEGPFGVSHG